MRILAAIHPRRQHVMPLPGRQHDYSLDAEQIIGPNGDQIEVDFAVDGAKIHGGALPKLLTPTSGMLLK
jgi:hypothetical protein